MLVYSFFESHLNELGVMANVFMALIALCSLLYSLYVGRREKKSRTEDLRARLSFSIVDWHDLYMLKITNVGKESAYNVLLNISGQPVEQSLFSIVKVSFGMLSKNNICLEAGKSAYYLISPNEKCRGTCGLEGEENVSASEVRAWLKQYDNEKIHIFGKYCDKYQVNESISIREFLLYGSFEHKEAIDEIADTFVSRDPIDNNIQKNVNIIAKAANSFMKSSTR